MLLDAQRSLLLIVDVQQALLPAMADPGRVTRGAAILMKAAPRLEIPLLVSEQYPRGLGPTVPELAELAPAGTVLPKLHFSCTDDPELGARLRQSGRDQMVLAGIEAHVCVLQTALGLKAAGLHPFVVADATASRTAASHQAALARLGASGVAVGTVEMVVFEWLNRAGTPVFKDLSPLIK